LILLPGKASIKLRKYFRRFSKMKVLKIDNLKETVKRAEVLVRSGDIVLFSPAASFNMFKDEFEYGRQFCQLIKSL